MGLYREIEVKRFWYKTAIEAATTVYATTMDLGDFIQGGTFSIHYDIDSFDATTMEFGYKVSNVASDLIFSTGGHVIATGVSSTSGTLADGKDVVSFTPDFARYMQLYAWNIGTAGVSLSLWFAGQ